jgi:ankyrin repeat protein
MNKRELQEKFNLSIHNTDFNEYRELLKAGASVNEPDSENCMITPLLIAVDDNCTQIVKDLLENGADVNLADRDGTTPLIMAAQRDNLENIKLLIQHGADVNL